jgi:hypothetical protein
LATAKNMTNEICIPSELQLYLKEMGDPAGSDPTAARARWERQASFRNYALIATPDRRPSRQAVSD